MRWSMMACRSWYIVRCARVARRRRHRRRQAGVQAPAWRGRRRTNGRARARTDDAAAAAAARAYTPRTFCCACLRVVVRAVLLCVHVRCAAAAAHAPHAPHRTHARAHAPRARCAFLLLPHVALLYLPAVLRSRCCCAVAVATCHAVLPCRTFTFFLPLPLPAVVALHHSRGIMRAQIREMFNNSDEWAESAFRKHALS